MFPLVARGIYTILAEDCNSITYGCDRPDSGVHTFRFQIGRDVRQIGRDGDRATGCHATAQ